jgi:hypothetical protein
MYSMHIRSDWLHCGLRIRVLPYSRHDAQEWGAFGSDRNNPGDGASGMGFSLYGAERSSRAGSSGEAVLIAHYAFGAFSVAVFFFVFHKRQS